MDVTADRPVDETKTLREQDAASIDIAEVGLSAWQRLSVNDAANDPVLRSIESYLDEPETRSSLWQLEADEEYPAPVLDRLRELGLMRMFAPNPDTQCNARVTAFHMSALNAVTSRRDTSLAVTISVNALGLLPAYVAATPEQLEKINAAVGSGIFSSLMLSEIGHGSNLLANHARAERGVLDGDDEFVPIGDDEECTHYRINGEKDLINGANRHGLMFVFLRTRNFTDGTCNKVDAPMQARADFTMFCIERGPGMVPLPRWHTMPARGADISGLRFENMVVPKSTVLGREHGGMTLAQKTLALSRGGVASLASGCTSRARDLAVTYAGNRAVYGEPIRELDVIADHLIRIEALDRAVGAIAVRTAALLNSHGVGAAHYTAVAKVVACVFAEEAVREGHRVLGARALLRDMPYERLSRDVVLYGVFDGTSHVMLQELSHRLMLEARRAAEPPREDAPNTVEQIRRVYAAEPEPVYLALRKKQNRLLMPLEDHLRELDQLNGACIDPIARACDALFACVRACEANDVWKDDHGLRHDAALLYAQIEGLVALFELGDPERRAALGVPPIHGDENPLDALLVQFSVYLFGCRTIAGIRDLANRAQLAPGWLDAELGDAVALADVETAAAAGHRELLRDCRAAIRSH